MSLPKNFKPSKNYKLERIGNNNDGGYLVGKNTIENTKSLISLGIFDDCSFEKSLKNKKFINIFCFDQINYKTFWKKKIYNDFGACFYNLNFLFFKNTLKKYFLFKSFFKDKTNFLNQEYITRGSLLKILKNFKIDYPFFLKVDIEGSEYRILDEIIYIQNKICGLVIEFHDVDLHKNDIIDFIKKLNLPLTHIHPNNYGKVDMLGDPIVLEMTFEKEPNFSEGENYLPNFFDEPCDPRAKEIILQFSNNN